MWGGAGRVERGPREGFLEGATFQVHLKMAEVPKAEMGTHPRGSTWLEQRYKDRWNQEKVRERQSLW